MSGDPGGEIQSNISRSGNTVSGNDSPNSGSDQGVGGGGGSDGNVPLKSNVSTGGNSGNGNSNDIINTMNQYGGGGGRGDWTTPENDGSGVFGGRNGRGGMSGMNGTVSTVEV